MKRLLLAGICVAVLAFAYWTPADAIEIGVPEVQSLSAAASDETPGTPLVEYLQCRETVVHIEWGTGVTAGAIQVEAARTASYAGTWAAQGSTVAFSGTAPNATTVHITGAFHAVRTRIETAVANGTVSTWIGCN